MSIFKRDLALYRLAQTKLPKAVYDHVSFASQVLALPPAYKMRKVKIIATPPDKEDTKTSNKVWTEDPDGTPKKRLIFSKSGGMLEGLQIGPRAKRFLISEPCKVPKKARELLEIHCYVHTTKFVSLSKYQYILTNNKNRFGDFHALMPALFGKAAHDPDPRYAYLKTLKNEAKELRYAIPSPMAKALFCSPGLQAKQRCSKQRCSKKQTKPLTRRRNF
jgi:hypothetical protein